jgi:hypothetical protein
MLKPFTPRYCYGSFYIVFDVTIFIGMYILRTDQFKSIAGARLHNSSIKRGVFCLDIDVVSFYTL